ncbi:MAG: Cys-tRNA(Pro) deacylase [Christensenella sp.]|nr:Cys-tRNA(Pro) deacylase [Christensenella sp.]
MAEAKTNAMRILDRAKISYRMHEYDNDGTAQDGVTVAQKLGVSEQRVYKTLVAQGADRRFFVFVIPVARELDLKKAARAVGEKNVELIHVKALLQTTGYIRGGCSPIGMKKQFDTVVDISCKNQEMILVSAGKIGRQIEIAPQDLLALIVAKTADLLREL